jgi:hypothetical protein
VTIMSMSHRGLGESISISLKMETTAALRVAFE